MAVLLLLESLLYFQKLFQFVGHASLEFTRRFDSQWEGRDWRVEIG